MGQILPGVPVWSMSQRSRWPGLPLVVIPGNVGSMEALSEAMIKVNHGMSRGAPHISETRQQRHNLSPQYDLLMFLTLMTRDIKQRPQSRQLEPPVAGR